MCDESKGLAWALSILVALVFLSCEPRHASAQQTIFDNPPSEVDQNASRVSAPPRLQIDETSFDFGTLSTDEGGMVRHAFKVRNLGSGELQIMRVTPGWGCTVAKFDRAIPPGGEGQIILQLYLHNLQGFVQKSSTVYTNDPQLAQFELLMKAYVRQRADRLWPMDCRQDV